MSGKKEASIYIHIPFCSKKCDYCHFYVIPDKEDHKSLLLKGLRSEIDSYSNEIRENEIVSVYFGGGTPALFGPERIEKVLSLFPNLSADCEITLEANPENITQELMNAYRQAGINRASIGVQSLNEPLLKTLSRQHSSQKAMDAIEATFAAGIENISIDLMYDLPGQTLDTWIETLNKATELPISHLSLYNLTFEPHTVFFKKREKLTKFIPSEEISREMYERAISIFEKGGLNQYEISAFAKNNKSSRHNLGYWTGRPFLGFGPSAYSYWNGKRFRNVENLNKYCKALDENASPIDFIEELDQEAKQRELLVIGIRVFSGVDLQKFVLDQQTLDSIDRLVSEGFLSLEKNTLKLTFKGILFYDSVASQLI
jgi:oxygen-independent coproporphyrinogen-3 oxidase